MKNIPSPASKSPRYDSPEQEAFLNLWRTYDRLKALEEHVFSQYDLSAQQYNALRILKAAAPGTLPTLTLGSRLISRAPDMTRLLDRLELRGWIVRERRADNRRVVEVGITPAGKKLLAELAGRVRACHRQQLGHLTPPQLQQLSALLVLARAPHEGALDTPDSPHATAVPPRASGRSAAVASQAES